jgi:hypothetical protein
MSTDAVLQMIKDEDAAYVDIRFTDVRGKLQHVTVDVDLVDEDFLEEGFMFDGSSIAGWKSIENSDMKLMADTTSAYVDPFYAEKPSASIVPSLSLTPAKPMSVTHAARPRKLKPTSSLPALVTWPTWVPKQNSSCSTTCVTPTRSTRFPMRSTQQTPPGTPTPSTKWATWATALALKVVTSQ